MPTTAAEDDAPDECSGILDAPPAIRDRLSGDAKRLKVIRGTKTSEFVARDAAHCHRAAPSHAFLVEAVESKKLLKLHLSFSTRVENKRTVRPEPRIDAIEDMDRIKVEEKGGIQQDRVERPSGIRAFGDVPDTQIVECPWPCFERRTNHGKVHVDSRDACDLTGTRETEEELPITAPEIEDIAAHGGRTAPRSICLTQTANLPA